MDKVLASRERNAGVEFLGPSRTPARGSYYDSPRRDSGGKVVKLASKARDSVGRRLELSRKEDVQVDTEQIIGDLKYMSLGDHIFQVTKTQVTMFFPLTSMRNILNKYW